MTKKEFLELIKNVPDAGKLKFGYGVYRPERDSSGHTTFFPMNRVEIKTVEISPKGNILFPLNEK